MGAAAASGSATGSAAGSGESNSLHALAVVRSKLAGTDGVDGVSGSSGAVISVAHQVRRLVAQAQSPDLWASMFAGWQAGL
jgi:hypothetical protein